MKFIVFLLLIVFFPIWEVTPVIAKEKKMDLVPPTLTDGEAVSQSMVIHLYSGGVEVQCYRIAGATVRQDEGGFDLLFTSTDKGLIKTNLEFVIEQFGECPIPLAPIISE